MWNFTFIFKFFTFLKLNYILMVGEWNDGEKQLFSQKNVWSSGMENMDYLDILREVLKLCVQVDSMDFPSSHTSLKFNIFLFISTD